MIKTIGVLLGIVLMGVSGVAARERRRRMSGSRRSPGGGSRPRSRDLNRRPFTNISTAPPIFIWPAISRNCRWPSTAMRRRPRSSWRCTATEHPGMPLESTVRNACPRHNVLPVGAQGYIDKNILNFVAGSYYVKISSANTGAEDREVLQAFARRHGGGIWMGREGCPPS